MDNLKNIKDLWQSQGESSIRFSQSEIHDMVQKKSSSIVKWILVISVLEFILPNLLILFTDFRSTQNFYEKYHLSQTMTYYAILHLIVIFVFIYIFYKNYRSISVRSSVKKLLNSILKTRRTVKYYIYYNLIMMGIIGMHIFYAVYSSVNFIEELPQDSNMTIVWLVSIGLLVFVILVFWAFYRLVYGYFLRKLKSNYAALLSNHSI